MRKLVLLSTILSVFTLCGLLIADEAVKKEVVYDGDKVGESAKGWAAPGSGKATLEAQDKEVRTPGKKTVEFHAEGAQWMGGGWNWFGWYPEDGGTDISAYGNLSFWAKVTGDKKPTSNIAQLSATLVSSEKGKNSEGFNLFTVCPDLADGKWHEVTIPIKDLDSKNGLNRTKVWEIMLGVWANEPVNFSLFVDEIGFTGKGAASSAPATSSPSTHAPATSVAAASVATALPVEIGAQDANIRYIGRWDMTKPAAPRASWTYTLVTAKFKGTAINGKLNAGGFYQVTIDGQPTSVIAPKAGQDVYELAKNLPDAEHVVEIVRRNEGAWIAPFTFLGFQLDTGGKLLPLPPRSNRRILIIGDSISCGYGNEATHNEGNPPAKQNGYMTYGAIAARKLAAEVQIVAWSGRKLYPDNTMPEVYDRIIANDANPKADLKAWVPDVVLINLGTNDFGNGAKKQPDEKGWTDAYKAFIKTIRATAPKSYVFVASGSMGTAANWDKWAKAVVADLAWAGDKNIAYLPFPTQDIQGDGIGGHWHPNLKTQTKMGERLAKEIEKAVGWKAE